MTGVIIFKSGLSPTVQRLSVFNYVCKVVIETYDQLHTNLGKLGKLECT